MANKEREKRDTREGVSSCARVGAVGTRTVEKARPSARRKILHNNSVTTKVNVAHETGKRPIDQLGPVSHAAEPRSRIHAKGERVQHEQELAERQDTREDGEKTENEDTCKEGKRSTYIGRDTKRE